MANGEPPNTGELQRTCDELRKSIEFLRVQREHDVQDNMNKRHDLRDALSARILQVSTEQLEQREAIGNLKARVSTMDSLFALITSFSEKIGRLSERQDILQQGAGKVLGLFGQGTIQLVIGVLIGVLLMLLGKKP